MTMLIYKNEFKVQEYKTLLKIFMYYPHEIVDNSLPSNT
jgi:hypothetical protein